MGLGADKEKKSEKERRRRRKRFFPFSSLHFVFLPNKTKKDYFLLPSPPNFNPISFLKKKSFWEGREEGREEEERLFPFGGREVPG